MKARRLRRLTSWVLLLWLLTLGTSFANACTVRELVRQAVHSMMHEQEVQASHSTIDCELGHDHSSHDAPCKQFRTDHSALPQSAKQHSDSSADHWLVAAPGPVLVLPVLPEEGGATSREPPGDPPHVPIPIAFLRLTL